MSLSFNDGFLGPVDSDFAETAGGAASIRKVNASPSTKDAVKVSKLTEDPLMVAIPSATLETAVPSPFQMLSLSPLDMRLGSIPPDKAKPPDLL